jgi:transcription antitermination factor NusG
MAQTIDAQLPPEQKVRILSGSFPNFIGTVQGKLPVQGKVAVTLSVFGRPMLVELDRQQVRPIQ